MMKSVPQSGTLDFVTAWYVRSAEIMQQHPGVRAALVSTNSITQGEQVGLLWPYMHDHGIHIQFGHRTFAWQSAAKGKAAVHCVIIGFGLQADQNRHIFDYVDPKAEPILMSAKNINGYLVDAPNTYVQNRRTPICDVPQIGIGNKPIDGGNYLFSEEERDDFLKDEPQAARFFREWLGAREFLNNDPRYCLCLGDATPNELKSMPMGMERIKSVRELRLSSSSKPTQKIAQTPTRFHVENFPDGNYLFIPRVSSEKRFYMPVGFIDPSVLSSDSALISKGMGKFEFGVMNSHMHNAWMRTTCGRLKSDYRYSAGVVYNNFPWPVDVSSAQRIKIEECAQSVLDARQQFPESSLADLYDPLTMPPLLTRAHQALDKAVDATYGRKSFKGEAERVASLFERYSELVEET